jgi:hypothetical protein
MCIRCRGKVITEPLPSNDRGIFFTEPLTGNDRGNTYRKADRWERFMKYGIEMGSGAMI